MSALNDIQSTLMRLMYGYNYQVTFGSDMFENCTDEDQFRRRLQSRYSDAKPEHVKLVVMNKADVWEEINFGLNYRGDRSAGLILNEGKERELSEAQTIYRETIQQYMEKATMIYSYPDDEGLPLYPVYWGYQFALFLDSGDCVFIYGASSD